MPTMKALSIKNPYATYIILGEKTVEVRSWRTKYRGPLLIVSSASPKIGLTGHALGFVELVECRPFRPRDARAACGPWEPGFYAWVLGRPRAIRPFPVKGQLNLYPVKLPRGL